MEFAKIEIHTRQIAKAEYKLEKLTNMCTFDSFAHRDHIYSQIWRWRGIILSSQKALAEMLPFQR